jgi:SAM-dependent methyltransferase
MKSFILDSEHPVARDSVDHLYPHGTANDNTHWPPFVEACERLFASPLCFLDLGCAGGGLVKDFVDRGHYAVGLEGSDYSERTGRAEWTTIPGHLATCDIRRPFHLSHRDGTPLRFDVISAWDVLEHIDEVDLPVLLENVFEHLKDAGVFVGSVSTRPARALPDGRNYHATVQPVSWWHDLFGRHAFTDAGLEAFAFHAFPRGNGNNYPANFKTHPETGFHFVLRKSRDV